MLLLFLIEFILIGEAFLSAGFSKKDENFGLYCYTGKQGKGKTYSAIKFCIDRKIQNDYIIITNVKSFKVFDDTIYLDDITKIINFIVNKPDIEKQKYLIFFDEIFTILEKRTPMNKQILSFISQLRKRKIIFVTTAQEWSEINITFRRYVRFQVDCNMFSIMSRAFLINKINDGDGIRWNNDLQDFEAPLVATNFSKGNKSVIDAYDTFETISTK